MIRKPAPSRPSNSRQKPLLVLPLSQFILLVEIPILLLVVTCSTGNKLWIGQAWTCQPSIITRRTMVVRRRPRVASTIPQLLPSLSSFSSSSRNMSFLFYNVLHDAQHTRTRTTNANSRLVLLHATAPRDNDTSTASKTTTPPLPDTRDPYEILNIAPTADRNEIKRAYRRMALLYHPDVRTNGNSSEQERKSANDDFARINAAYAFLMGKSDEQPQGQKSGSGSSSSSSSRYGGYAPPHRRTSSSSSSNYSSMDWQDFMPKYDQEEYDAGGDSFASIFADLLSGIGSTGSGVSSGGGGGILNDLISFLEGNFPSVGKSQQTQEDVILNALLRDGSREEIKDELDDAKLLVKQLEQKQMDLDSELQSVNIDRQRMMDSNGAGMGKSKTYMEDMRLEERKRELEVRKEVVGEYLERARMRQFRLRKRMEELKMERDYTRSSSQTDSNDSFSRSSTGNYYGSGVGVGGVGGGGTNYQENGTDNGNSNYANVREKDGEDEPSWKTEGFGTSRRRRRSSSSSSRSRSSYSSSSRSNESGSSRSTTNATSRSYDSSSSSSGSASTRRWSDGTATGSYASSSSSQSTTSNSYRNTGNERSVVPPHRRLTSRYEQVQQDKKRLREIKVDEEIEKMKKELGLN